MTDEDAVDTVMEMFAQGRLRLVPGVDGAVHVELAGEPLHDRRLFRRVLGILFIEIGLRPLP